MGFTAAKFDPFPGPWRTFVDRRDEDFAIDYVRAMRQALGADFELLIEAHRRFSPAHAIRIGHRLAEFGIDWYEEPCLSENIDLVAEVRRAVPIPIVTGEAIYTKEAFFECLAKRAADILNPDICVVGGITAMLDIAAMAQPQAVVMAPHNYNSTLAGLAATVHLSAVIPNFRIAEYFVNFRGFVPRNRDRVTDGAGWLGRPADRPGSRASISMSISCAPTRTRKRLVTASASTGRNTRAKATHRLSGGNPIFRVQLRHARRRGTPRPARARRAHHATL